MTYKQLSRPLCVLALALAGQACGSGAVDDTRSAVTGQQPSNPYGSESPGSPPRPGGDTNCTFTQGYWKNHASAWPVAQLKLGDVTYDKAQLLAILRTPVKGNGLISMAHQLIAARLNLASGAAPAGLDATLAEADRLIGSLVVPPVGQGHLPTSRTTAVNDALAAFNEGKTGPGHCGDGVRPPPGGSTPYPPGDPVPPGGSTPYPPSDPVPPGGSTPYPPSDPVPPPPAPPPPPPPAPPAPPVIIE